MHIGGGKRIKYRSERWRNEFALLEDGGWRLEAGCKVQRDRALIIILKKARRALVNVNA